MIGKNWLERLVFVLGLALVLGLAAFFTREALSGPPAPPRLGIELDPAREEGDQVLVPVKVHNVGDEPAEEVVVEVRLGDGPGTRFTIDHLPGGATREGMVTFDRARSPGGQPEAWVAGYRLP